MPYKKEMVVNMKNRIFFGKVNKKVGGVEQLKNGYLIGPTKWFGQLKKDDIAIISEDRMIRNIRKVDSIEKINNNELKYKFSKILAKDFDPAIKGNDILNSVYFKFDKDSANKSLMPGRINFNELNLNEEYINVPIEEFVFDKDSSKNIYFLTEEEVLEKEQIEIKPRDILFIVSNKETGYQIKEVYNYTDKKIKENINLQKINGTLNIEKYSLKEAYEKASQNNEKYKCKLLIDIINSLDEKNYYFFTHDKRLNDLYAILKVNNSNDKSKDIRNNTPKMEDITALTKIKNLDENLKLSEDTECSYNQIFYGVPGCGKSYKINKILNENKISDEQTEKILFHPDYNYTDFVGQLEPKIIKDYEKNKNEVTYEFNPGPFSIILKKALTDKNKNYVLVIDEINRGNAPAIFGDIFQLLDRNEDGESEYSITNKTITDYLIADKDGISNIDEKFTTNIKIPKNLYIFASMNTSDQNVFTLDTAFKRRWNFEKLSNIFNKENKKDRQQYNKIINGLENIKWGVFQETINSILNNRLKEYGINGEDKQLGKYFVKDDELNNKNKFAYKVLMYLWDDAVKLDRSILFNTEDEEVQTLDDVIDGFLNKKGINIFSKEVTDKIKEKM